MDRIVNVARERERVYTASSLVIQLICLFSFPIVLSCCDGIVKIHHRSHIIRSGLMPNRNRDLFFNTTCSAW